MYIATAHASNYTTIWTLGHIAQPSLDLLEESCKIVQKEFLFEPWTM